MKHTFRILVLTVCILLGAVVWAQNPPQLTVTAHMGSGFASSSVKVAQITLGGTGTPTLSTFFDSGGNLSLGLPGGGTWQFTFCNTSNVCFNAGVQLLGISQDITSQLTAATASGGSASFGTAFFASSACGGATNCVQWVDDDSTDNCGAATTSWLALINGYAGKGVPQVLIYGSGSGKAYKFATCNLAFTNSQGATINLAASIDCAMALQSCIQFGTTNTSGGAVSYPQTIQAFTLKGGGTLIGGAALTGSGGNGSGVGGGVYMMPQASSVTIDGINFGGSGTNKGFGESAASYGSCNNYAIFFDYPIPTGSVSNSIIWVNTNGLTSGGCGVGNPNGRTTGSNTVVINNNLITTDGESGGVGQCGSIGINDGGTYGTMFANNIYGFGIPILLQGASHKVVGNQLDSTQCTAGAVSADIQIGGSAVVGPASIESNSAQVGTNHATNFMAFKNGATASLTNFNILNNLNSVANTPGNLFNPLTTSCANQYSTGPSSYGGSYCLQEGNVGFYAIVPCGGSNATGWQAGMVLAACYPSAASANITTTTLYPNIANPQVNVGCAIVLSTAATTSSTLPQCVISWTDVTTSQAQSATITNVWASGAIGCSGSTTNTIGNSCQGTILISPKNGTNVSFSTTNYASTGGTAMVYQAFISASVQ